MIDDVKGEREREREDKYGNKESKRRRENKKRNRDIVENNRRMTDGR